MEIVKDIITIVDLNSTLYIIDGQHRVEMARELYIESNINDYLIFNYIPNFTSWNFYVATADISATPMFNISRNNANVETANKAGIVMVFTEIRHFKH